MSQSTNSSFKEILTTASNNYLKKPLTDTLNSLTNMASYSNNILSSTSSATGSVSNKKEVQSSASNSYYSSLNGASSSSLYNSVNDENDKSKNKVDQLEFLTTVGTGTFGRVIVVRQKNSQEFYALKIMSIAEVLRLKQTEHVKNEKDILQQVYHPFIINLYVLNFKLINFKSLTYIFKDFGHHTMKSFFICYLNMYAVVNCFLICVMQLDFRMIPQSFFRLK